MDKNTFNLQRYFSPHAKVIGLTVIFLGAAIFVLREHIAYFYGASVALTALTALIIRNKKVNGFAVWLLVLSAIGLSAATILTVEKIELLKDPNFVTSCSISPVVSCSSITESGQAGVFGLPNSLIGIFAFTALLTAGMTLLAGAKKLTKEWWLTVFAGAAFGALFSIWLIFQGLYRINALCLYCMATWMVSFALFWLVLGKLSNENIIKSSLVNKIAGKPLQPIIVSILLVLMIVFLRWQSYWLSLL